MRKYNIGNTHQWKHMKRLLQLQKILEENYRQYKLGNMTEKEYIIRVKPIDQEIGKIEMSTLLDTSGLKEPFLLHSRTRKP